MESVLGSCFGYKKENDDKSPPEKVKWYIGDGNEPISFSQKKKKK